MSVLAECKNICMEYGDNIVLKDINLKINYGDKIGIVGNNGEGKTTLAKIIAGKIKPSKGSVVLRGNINQIGYLKQEPEYYDAIKNLSFGLKTKKLITEVFNKNYEFIILDEPTNHMDLKGISYLYNKVNSFKGTVLIISHDRYFLDKCTYNIIEVNNKSIKRYNGNYSYYRKEKNKEFEDSMKAYMCQEKVKKSINAQIDILSNWSHKAHRDAAKKAIETGNKFGGKQHNRAKAKKMDKQIKSRIKRLKRIETEGLTKPKEEEKVYFNIADSKKSGNIILKADNISKSFGDKLLFKDSSFYVKRGEKVGIVGDNGTGKTTLIKGILGKIKIEGDIYLNSNLSVGYLSQDINDLDENQKVIELFSYENYKEEGIVREKLYLLGFDKESLSKKIGDLSSGQKMKLKLLCMINKKCDILILDEPTNHIDLHVREQLETMLEEYSGTILLITHDRYMMEKIADKLIVFENRKIKRYEYGYDRYIKSQNTENDCKDDIIIINNKIASLIGKLSTVSPESEEYKKFDKEYKSALEIKKKLLQ